MDLSEDAVSAQQPRSTSPLSAMVRQEEEQARHKCMAASLRSVPRQAQAFLIQYYLGQKHQREKREELAQDSGISAENLRVKIHQLKKTLRTRMEKCLRSRSPKH